MTGFLEAFTDSSFVATNQSKTKAERLALLSQAFETGGNPIGAFCVCLSTLEDDWENLEETIAIGDKFDS